MIDITGQRFGRLRVLEYAFTKKHRAYWECLCDCGKITFVPGTNLRTSTIISCGCSRRGIRQVPKKYDETGKCFGKLKVLERDKETSGCETKWVCLCECGKKTVVRRSDLINAHTTSCGCIHHNRGNKHFNWRGCGEIPYSLWSSIKFGRSRKTKKLDFDITIEDIWQLFLKQKRKCALSGVPIEFTGFVNNSKQTTASLDRIDSSKGYTKENIQWVHKTINQMKMDITQDEFIRFCKAVAKGN